MLNFPLWKSSLIIGVCLFGILCAIPNALAPDQRGWLPALFQRTVNLGLDLQGGAHLLFEVKVDEVFDQRLQNLTGEIRDQFRAERIGYSGGIRVVGDMVRVTIRDPGQVDEARRIVRDLAEPTGGAIGFGGGTPDIELQTVDGNRFEIRLTDTAKQQLQTTVLSQAIEVVRRRIDELGTREPVIQRQGDDRIIVQVPGESDPQKIKELVSKTARLTFHKEDTSVSIGEALAGRVPPQSQLLPMKPDAGDPRTHIVLEKRAILTGDQIINASQSTDQVGAPAVAFRLNGQGARRFGDFSSDNIGRVFAIVLDGEVISAPVIRGAILTGEGQISGGFASFQEAEDLAVLLRAGALPASLTVIQERSVGAELGADSIAAGEFASIIGVSAVILFMLAAYGLFGGFAVVALVINLTLVVGALSLLGATLTLPGIAGIALTLGMAVDANVLVFERMREEIRAGKSALNAIETGYQKAMSTILDANITTLIAASILFFLGSGPVRGFAVTLAIGIVTSVFTAVSVTRLMVAYWYRWRRPAKLPI